MTLQALRGTSDLLGPEISRWSWVERHVRRLAGLYGYSEVRTPLIEDAALFLRSVGETTDIVQKEMFRFTDRGGHEIVLRPEGTAAVVRSYLEHNLHKTLGLAKLVYLGPMFRAERPQAGRFRQFHQFGVEAIGSESPWIDVEVMGLCLHILRACGVVRPRLWVSSMGCRADQERSAQRLRERLAPVKESLCTECRHRFDRNIFRVLDCKKPRDHAMAWREPGSPFLLCDACTAHFSTVREGLRAAQVPFDDTTVFARGLDYYTRTVFEVRAEGLGAQDAVAAGGRYDHLVEELGGPHLGACGFAAGIERVLIAAQGAASPGEPGRQGLYLAVAQPAMLPKAFEFVQGLREAGLTASLDYEGRSLKAQLREADKSGFRLLVILGQQELQQGTVTIKDLEQGTQEAVALSGFVEAIAKRLTRPGSATCTPTSEQGR